MKKRYRDADIWKQSWFINLPIEYKLVWDYINDNCHTSGLWEIDVLQLKRTTGISSFDMNLFLHEVNRDYDKITGKELNKERVLSVCEGRKLFITNHLMFQWSKGEIGLSPKVAAVKGALLNLYEHVLLEFALNKKFIKVVNGYEGLATVIKGYEGLATIEEEEVEGEELNLFKEEVIGETKPPEELKPESALEPLAERKSKYGGPDYISVENVFVSKNRPAEEAAIFWNEYESKEWCVHNKEGTGKRKITSNWRYKAENWIYQAILEEAEKKENGTTTRTKNTGNTFKRTARGEVSEQQLNDGLAKAFGEGEERST